MLFSPVKKATIQCINSRRREREIHQNTVQSTSNSCTETKIVMSFKFFGLSSANTRSHATACTTQAHAEMPMGMVNQARIWCGSCGQVWGSDCQHRHCPH